MRCRCGSVCGTNGMNFWLAGLPIEEWLWILGVTLMFGLLTVLLMEKEREAECRRSHRSLRTCC